ncbi:MAG: 3-ketoacyl-ACP reductase [Phreatobacter sp.]|uniref:3-ketoacyl-ACP reductase n=1 Tax=Phreatobacter sp. TaxID=1966341 RepID=UPI001A44553A|nr:3-ketoacyl-ACP reductase [Phreatobacter sp.]MBL8571393.1 3-ketoacyl-ACP reductase [Phreatobacter sp.]
MEQGGRRVAFVTGAQRGIGRGIALALAARGFDLVLNDLAASSDLDATAAAAREAGARVTTLAGDIADLGGQGALVTAAWDAFGRIDCLVNNAGVSVKTRGDMLDSSPESFDRLITINLRGPFFLTQAVAKRMVAAPASGFRSIVTVSSLNAEAASPDRAEYCISKIGLSMMSKLYALRLAEAGIRAYEIRPGVIRTDMTAVAREKYDRMFASGFSPISRWGEPEDIGRAVAMLADGALAYSTGEVVHVDGGLSVAKL